MTWQSPRTLALMAASMAGLLLLAPGRPALAQTPDPHAGHGHDGQPHPGAPAMPPISEDEKKLIGEIAKIHGQIQQDPSAVATAKDSLIELLSQHQDKYPQSPFAPRSMQELVTIHMQSGDADKAEAVLEGFIKSRSNPIERGYSRMFLAEVRKSTGNFEGAIQTLKAVYASRPDEELTRKAALELSSTLAESGEVGQARETLQAHIKLEKDPSIVSQFALRLADLSIQAGDYDQAIEELEGLEASTLTGPPADMREILIAQSTFARGRQRLGDPATRDEGRKDLEAAKGQYQAFLSSHTVDPKNPSPTFALAYSAAADLDLLLGDVDGARGLYEQMAKAYEGRPESMYALRAAKDLDWIGKDAPDFTGTGLDGTSSIKLADFKGQYVFLDFWATWCGPCLAELPNVIELNKAMGEKIKIVSISLDPDEKRKSVQKFVETKGMDWEQVMDGKAWQSAIVKAYDVTGIPATFLVGPDGKIVRSGLRGTHQLEATIQAIMTSRAGEDASGDSSDEK